METVEKAKNPISGESEDLSQEDMITLAILKKARTGDVRAYKELMDSLYGTAKDTIDLRTENAGIDFDELMEKLSKNAKS